MTVYDLKLRYQIKFGMTKHNLTHHAELDFLILRHAEFDSASQSSDKKNSITEN
jgi:hypothetical protein